MRRQLTHALFLCVSPIICLAQQPSHNLSDYVGTWQAKFHGTTFITIKLVEKDGQFTGSANYGDMSVDLSGEIIRVEAPEGDTPIVSSRLLPHGGLEVTSKGEDPNDTITVVLKITDASTGSIRFLQVPGDTSVVKPIAVEKTLPTS